MASGRDYLEYILEQLPETGEVTFRPMMGEFIIYFREKVIGGIYDDRFLIKPTESSKRLLPNAPLEAPYEGAREMLLVEETDNREFLKELLEAMYPELPAPKKKHR